jgi:hypothetical protein
MYEIRKRKDDVWCIYLYHHNVVISEFKEYVSDEDINHFSEKTGIPIWQENTQNT